MIPFDEAYALIMENASALPMEHRSLDSAYGYCLARALTARDAAPRFDNSAVDGYAVIASDVQNASETSPIELAIVATIAAGSHSTKTLRNGQAMKIMTGAPVPAGTTAVVMKEYCDPNCSTVKVLRHAKDRENIRSRGEEFGKGTQLLEAGTWVTPPVAGLIATLGYATVQVHRKPRVSMIVTGSELRTPGATLRKAEIWESNSYALEAALKGMGVDPEIVRIADDTKRTQETVANAVAASDVVMSSGGISVGEYDYLREAFVAAGVRERFWKIAQKPGKPVYFGTKGKVLVFGLPGNPVAAVLSFYNLVRPALVRMMGGKQPEKYIVQAKLTQDLKKKTGMLEFVRMSLQRTPDGYEATPAPGQGSHMLGGLAFANGLYRFAPETVEVPQGRTVEIELL